MTNQTEILSTIKKLVQEEIPDAKVYLFGSRVTGKVHEESDWDILVLTEKKLPKSFKWLIHDKLFQLSVSIGSVFHLILTSSHEWKNHPGYYTLQKGIGNDYIAL